MEIIYFIGSLIIIGIIWNFTTTFIETRKENKKKVKEYPKILKELSNEKLVSKKHKENYENEKLKTNRFSSEIAHKNITLQNLISRINIKNKEFDKTIKYSENSRNELNDCEIEKNETELKLKEQVRINLELKSDLRDFETKYIEENQKLIDALKKIDILNEQVLIKDKLETDLINSETKYIEKNQKLISIVRERDDLKNTLKEQHDLYLSIESKSENSVTKITSMYSDFLLLEYDLIARRLENKKRPAISESKRIKELKTQSKFHIEQYRQMLYKYEYLLNIFPELTNYVDDFDTLKQLDDVNSIKEFKEDFDNVQNYLSKEEYFDYDEDYRNQLALDRYLKGKKTNWQIGRDYEMSCGITYEERGWEVEYFGMEKRLNDLGRDLIARKGNDVEIIQCKLWKKTKTIHEKHILQLYGTTIIDTLMNPDLFKVVTPVFITNTSLSETAMKFAKILGVRIEKWEMKEFPRIKCNIGIDSEGIETKIYHLPFDQHYDRTKIKKGQGFLAKNIKEATESGFRRSYKYYGR
ncbi:restriction endonuclease [Polaribacter sp. Z014]|nr:restriction endonuclease [Polaribacter sp. Z014]MCL7765456.1 restriction endonuclease [Polaribacter sp. Z014]